MGNRKRLKISPRGCEMLADQIRWQRQWMDLTHPMHHIQVMDQSGHGIFVRLQLKRIYQERYFSVCKYGSTEAAIRAAKKFRNGLEDDYFFLEKYGHLLPTFLNYQCGSYPSWKAAIEEQQEDGSRISVRFGRAIEKHGEDQALAMVIPAARAMQVARYFKTGIKKWRDYLPVVSELSEPADILAWGISNLKVA